KLAQEKRRSFVVVGDEPWTVIEGKRVPITKLQQCLHLGETLEDGVELTTDAEKSFHAGRAVSLAEHTANGERFVREYAVHCGLNEFVADRLAVAACFHDIGKADRRFQL